MAESRLWDEYTRLLKDHGLAVPSGRSEPAAAAATFHLMREAFESSGYADFSNYLESLKTKQAGMNLEFYRGLHMRMIQGGLGHQHFLQSLSQEIESTIRTLGYKLDEQILVAQFPTGAFNAEARRVTGGILVLINSGLVSFIRLAAKVMSFYVEFADFGSDGEHIPSTRTGKSSYTEQEKIDAMVELVLAYLLYSDPLATTRLPIEGEQKMNFIGQIIHSCVRFAIAHEYGHALAGHLGTQSVRKTRTSAGALDLIFKDWSMEFAADKWAAHLTLLSSAKQENGKYVLGIDAEHWYEVERIVAGPFLFFILDRLVTLAAQEIAGLSDIVIINDHPPPELRMEALEKYLASSFGIDEMPPTTKIYIDLLIRIERETIAAIKQNVDAIRERFRIAGAL